MGPEAVTLICLEEKGTTKSRVDAEGSGCSTKPGKISEVVNAELIDLWSNRIIPDSKECGNDLNSAGEHREKITNPNGYITDLTVI